MNKKSIVFGGVILVAANAFPLLSNAQQFQNLNFEGATTTQGESGNSVPATQGLPGWTVYLGNSPQSSVLFNNVNDSLASVDILGPGWHALPGVPADIIDGNYTAVLQSGTANGNLPFVSASIAQNGTVPTGSQSLQFKAWENFGASFGVSFNGNSLPLTVLASATAPSGQQYDLYGANISQYSGQTGLLEFTEDFGNTTGFNLLLDDINFSTSSVPEPSPAILIGLGGLFFALRQKLPRHKPGSFSTKP